MSEPGIDALQGNIENLQQNIVIRADGFRASCIIFSHRPSSPEFPQVVSSYTVRFKHCLQRKYGYNEIRATIRNSNFTSNFAHQVNYIPVLLSNLILYTFPLHIKSSVPHSYFGGTLQFHFSKIPTQAIPSKQRNKPSKP